MAVLSSTLLFVATLAGQGAPLGTWNLSQGDDIAGAIDQAIKDMSFVTRPIARGRLAKLNPAYHRVVIGRSGGDFTVQFDQRQPIRMPADGRGVSWQREDGEQFVVSARIEGDKLIQHFKGQDGERTNVFRRDDQGGLFLDVTVKSSKLPKPLTYSLNYRG